MAQDHSADNLSDYSEQSRGWKSERYCDYPQFIIIEIPKCNVSNIQFLLHQFSIPSKVEIFQDDIADESGNIQWKQLGQFVPSDNSSSSYSARELKSVYLNMQVTHLKFMIQECQQNQFNTQNQIGLINLMVYGMEVRNQQKAFLRTLNNFNILNTSQTDKYNKEYDRELLSRLKSAKAKAVLKEDFDIAKEVKEKIAQFDESMARVADLEQIKNEAIFSEDQDTAKEAKLRIKQIYENLEEMIEKISDLQPTSMVESVVEHPLKEEQKHFLKKTESDKKLYFDQQPERKQSNSSQKLIEQENSNEKEKNDENSNGKEKNSGKEKETKSQDQSRKQSKISVVESSTHSNPDDIKIKPKLDFEQLLELELQKEGISQNIAQGNAKPRKQFLKKGKMINEIYKNEPNQEPKAISPRKNRKSISPEKKEENDESPNNNKPKHNFLKKGKMIKEIQKTEEALNQNEPEKKRRGSKSPKGKKGKDDWKKICQFCGTSKFNSLDEHFLNDCPMLFNCKYCEQLVEIQQMNVHQKGECSKSSAFWVCNICDLPQPKSKKTKHSAQCEALDTGVTRCLVCNKYLSNTDDAWRMHLKKENCRFNIK